MRDKGLLREFKNQGTEEVDQFLIKLDDVDVNFIYTILDILDFYELFKLSLMLCNRYNLTERVGNYIL